MKFKTRIETLLLEEQTRWLLWLPVAMGLGVWLYFALPREPSPYAGGTAVLLALPSLFWWRRWPWLRAVLWALLAMAVGFAAAQWQTARMESPVVSRETGIVSISGDLAEILDTEKGLKLVIENPVMEGRQWGVMPDKIRLSLKKPDERLQVGQQIRLRGGLFPLPSPALPGGFDFSRHFYFQGIGAVGFGLQPVEILSEAELSGFAQWLVSTRHELAKKVRDSIENRHAGAVSAALITGERSAIAAEVKDAMMGAGLAHMLAISGLHLGLVAGILFVMARTVLVFIPGFALKYMVKKWAAALALLGGFGYLALAGFPVSAQRAYVMVALVLGAVMLDRRVLPMRSLALAAIVILLVSPEALLSPSFQLSFAATIAILTLVESYWTGKSDKPWLRESLLYKPLVYFGGIIVMSLAASLTTSPFVIYHFNQFTAWDVLGNLAASSLLSLWVMPSAVLAVLLMPLGLDGPLLWLMGEGVELILAVAFWVSSLPYALSYVPTISDGGMALIVLGGCWFCFWLTRWRWLGAPVVMAGVLSLLWVEQPDMLVSEKAEQIAFRLPDGNYAMLKGSMRNFNAGLWQEALGLEGWNKAGDVDEYRCDGFGCVLAVRGYDIAIPKNPTAMAEDCGEAAAIISAFYHDCEAEGLMIERPDMPVALYFGEEIRMETARSFIQRLRDAGKGAPTTTR